MFWTSEIIAAKSIDPEPFKFCKISNDFIGHFEKYRFINNNIFEACLALGSQHWACWWAGIIKYGDVWMV